MRNNIWSLLGIDPTDDKRAIKRAYAKQSQLYHPEEYPEEFKELQAAYQAALVWSRSPVEADVLLEEELEVPTYPSQPTIEDFAVTPFPSSEEETREVGGGVFRSSERTITDADEEFLAFVRQQLSLNFRAAALEDVLKQALLKGYLSDTLIRQEIEDILEQSLYNNSDENIAKLIAVYERYHFTRFAHYLQTELERRGYDPLSEPVRELEAKRTEKKSAWNYIGFVVAVVLVIRILGTANTTSHQTSETFGESQIVFENLKTEAYNRKGLGLSGENILPELTETSVELQHMDNMDWTIPLVDKNDQGYWLYIEPLKDWSPLEAAIEEIYIVVAERHYRAYYVIVVRHGEVWTVYDDRGLYWGEVEGLESFSDITATSILTYDHSDEVFRIKSE